MTHQHQATTDEWAQQSDWAQKQFSSSSCIVELLHRIEALEAAQRFNAGLTEADIKAAELAWARTAPGMRSDDLRLPAADAQQLALVERVADAIGAADDEGLTNMTWSNHSRAAIRVVAEWLRADALSDWGLAAADLLDNEANR